MGKRTNQTIRRARRAVIVGAFAVASLTGWAPPADGVTSGVTFEFAAVWDPSRQVAPGCFSWTPSVTSGGFAGPAVGVVDSVPFVGTVKGCVSTSYTVCPDGAFTFTLVDAAGRGRLAGVIGEFNATQVFITNATGIFEGVAEEGTYLGTPTWTSADCTVATTGVVTL